MKIYSSDFLIVLVAFLWGVIGLFTKPLLTMGFSSMQLVFVRSIISAVLLAIIILLKNKVFFKLKLKDLPIFIGAGISFTFCLFCYMASIGENGPGVAAMLMYSSPIWTMIISTFLFKEKTNFTKIFSLFGITAGCVMVCFGGQLKITLMGALLGIGSGIGLALISIFTKISASRGYSSFTSQFYIFLIVTVVSLPLAQIDKVPLMIATDYNSIIYFVLLALVSTIFPYLLYAYALKKIPASTAGILSSLEVVIGAFTGFIAFNENIGWLGILGILIMLFSIILLEFKPKKFKGEGRKLQAMS